ncbi:YdcF family protein [Komagataeibacter nataicola]|uniref:YdcF family protein n=1 Tax=Komagataeibacter nataicola TaxID=265960 RepID=UPI0038D23817
MQIDRQAGCMLPVVIFGAKLQPDGSPGRTLWLRLAAAHAYGEAHAPVLYIPTGGPSHPSGMREGEVMATLLGAAGVPPDALLVEGTAPDTLASVIACTRLLRQRGHVGPVAVASSSYHLPRCLYSCA